jgi:hypothetical protein
VIQYDHGPVVVDLAASLTAAVYATAKDQNFCQHQTKRLAIEIRGLDVTKVRDVELISTYSGN